MPMFQTFADYDKWRRRQLFLRLEKLQNLPLAPDSIVKVAEKAGDLTIKAGSPSRALMQGAGQKPMKSDPISQALKKAIISPSFFNGKVSPALRAILRQRILDFLSTGLLPVPPSKKGKVTGPGPNSRAGDDVVMAVTDGDFYTNRGSQLTGLPAGSGKDNITQSFFITIPAEVDIITVIHTNSASNRKEQIQFNAGGDIQFTGNNWLGAIYANQTTAFNILTPLRRAHIMWSSSNAEAKSQVWIDGVLIHDIGFTGTNDPLGNEINWHIFNNGSGSFRPAAGFEVGAFWQSSEFVDTPIGKFIEAAGPDPVPLEHGTDGSIPTGNTPLVFFNEIADWNAGTNQGTGGDYTVGGGAMS